MKRNPKSKSRLNSNYLIFAIFIALFLIGTGFVLGWYFGGGKTDQPEDNTMKALRLSGYKYISPLLACDPELGFSSKKMDDLSSDLKIYIESAEAEGKISQASVYVRDYRDGTSFEVNPELKFYPASLSKLPAMITTLKQSEEQKDLLATIHKYDDIDNNKGVEIPPSESLQPGQSYTALDAIDKMIRFSDNNGYVFLSNLIDFSIYNKTFQDLKVPLVEDISNLPDYMSAKDFSYFLRVLYNSTYLNPENSEKALEYLAEADYKNGLVAGVPADVKVAHKFGILTRNDNSGKFQSRELHDCGLVYKDKPYLVCVMTKGSSTLSDSETVIKDLSSKVYDSLRNNKN